MTEKDVEGRVGGTSRAVMLVLRFRAVTLILFLVITGLLALQVGHIRVTQNPAASMIPPGHGFFPALRAIEGMSTQAESLIGILEVREGDVYNKETVAKVDRITRELTGVEQIRPGGMLSLATGLNHYESTAEGLMGEPILGRVPPETEEDFQAVKRRVAVNPLGIGSYVSYDGKATMITAPIVDLDTKAGTSYGQLSEEEKAGWSLAAYKRRELEAFHRNLLGVVRKLKTKEEDGNHKLHFIGDRLLRAEMTSMGRRQIPLAAAAMLVLVVVLLAAYFRSFRGTLVPILAFALSVLWGLGILGASRIAFNPMAFLFPAMLGMMSLVCAALVIDEVDRSQTKGSGKMDGIASAYRRLPIVAFVLTVGLVSLALRVAGVPMIRELGALGLFWAFGTLVVLVLVCPVLVSLLPGPAKAGGGRHGGLCLSAVDGLAKYSGRLGKVGLWIVLAALLFAAVLWAGKPNVGDNTPGPSYVRSSHPWNQGFEVYAKRFNGPYTFLVYVRAKEEGGLLHPEAINEMGDFSTYLQSEGGARESAAFDWIVKLGRIALMDGNPKWWTIPASKEDVEGLSRLLTFPGGLEVLVDKPFSQATVVSFFPENGQERIDEYASTMQAYIDRHPSEHVEFILGGGPLATTKAINDGTRDAYRKTLAAALAAVFVVGVFVTGSALVSLTVTLTIAAGQAAVWWVLAAFGAVLSMAAVPAVVLGVGFGAVLGYSLARQGLLREDESVDSAKDVKLGRGRAAGGVIFFGILVFFGMLPWSLMGLKFQADMAIVLGATALLESIAAVVFVPTLTGRWKPQAR